MLALNDPQNKLINFFILFIFLGSYSVDVTAQQKVVGGEDANIRDYPWQVAVDYGCGGSIIADSWVLTAAHCVGSGVNYIYAGNSAPYAFGGETYSVNQVIIHPNYGSGTSSSHDFALVKINGEFNFDNPNIGKIDLITPEEVLAGSQDDGLGTRITGWGTLSSGGATSSTLQMVKATLISNAVACGSETDSNGNSGDYSCSSLDESMICAGDLIDGGEDACQGDSGGPLVVRSVIDYRWLLIGVTSWGNGCGNVNYPGVWSRVSYVYDWINITADIIYGCLDPIASNYNPDATLNDGSCIILGCTDPIAFNYNSQANQDDSNCLFYGCTDFTALNYNPEATNDDSSCEYLFIPEFFTHELSESNHTIVIPEDVQFNLLDGPISNTDIIGVFYTDENGLEHCGGYAVWQGTVTSIAAQGDDSTTDQIDGFYSGLVFNFKVWDSSEGTLYDFNVSYNNDMPNQGSFFANGISTVMSGQPVSLIVSQDLIFPQGWTIFSTYIQSDNMNLIDLTSEVQSHIVIVKDYMGIAYLPEWDFNGIGDVQFDQGYLIKTTQTCSITIDGVYVVPEENAISLLSGWNIISYLRLESAQADLVFSDLVALNNLIIAKDANGFAYLPDWGFNGIGDLEPGKGYQLKTNSPGELQYLSNIQLYE